MKDVNIIDLLKLMEGDIIPIGETNYDYVCCNNLRVWADTAGYILARMMTVSNMNNPEYSIRELRNLTRQQITQLHDILGDCIEGWED